MEQQADKPLALPPSRKLRRVQQLASVNVYGIFFSLGVAAANISRLFPYGGSIYAVVLISMIGLSLLKANVDAGKVIVLGSLLSAIAWWDAIIQFLVNPVFVGFWIVPLWQVILFGISGLMILTGILSAVRDGN